MAVVLLAAGWLARQRSVLSEKYDGGWPNDGQCLPKDMLVGWKTKCWSLGEVVFAWNAGGQGMLVAGQSGQLSPKYMLVVKSTNCSTSG
jgi:hypothetical protein